MMKAEMTSEITRSRSHPDNPEGSSLRWDFGGAWGTSAIPFSISPQCLPQGRMEPEDGSMRRSLFIALLALTALAMFAQTGDTPAYHKTAPTRAETKTLPPILGREKLMSMGFTQAVQLHAYELAAKVPNVLYQQPCYCHCDRAVGHTSLRSCFADDHGARCGTCMGELFYAYQMTRQGKTPAQIRAGIEKGDWQKIDLKTAATMN